MTSTGTYDRTTAQPYGQFELAGGSEDAGNLLARIYNRSGQLGVFARVAVSLSTVQNLPRETYPSVWLYPTFCLIDSTCAIP